MNTTSPPVVPAGRTLTALHFPGVAENAVEETNDNDVEDVPKYMSETKVTPAGMRAEETGWLAREASAGATLP
jgi:hypothetical protein